MGNCECTIFSIFENLTMPSEGQYSKKEKNAVKEVKNVSMLSLLVIRVTNWF